MESDIIVEGFLKSVKMYGVMYARFVGDGDSNVHKKVLDARPYINNTVEKIECKNHLFRNMCNKIKNLARNKKLGNVTLRKLIGERMLRLRKDIAAAVKYRKNENISEKQKLVSLREEIINAPFHVFGQHEKCASYFSHKENEKNNVPSLKSSGLFGRVMEIVSCLADHTRSLLKDTNNNVVEQFNSIVAKFVGGKRINYCLKGSYETRCYAAVVSHNSKTPIQKLHSTMFGCSPRAVCKRFEERNRLRRIRDCARNKLHGRKRLFSNVVDRSSYGTNAQRPDVDPSMFNAKKEDFLHKLKLNEEERKNAWENTTVQSLPHMWVEERRKRLTASKFGEVCNKRPYTFCDNIVKKILYKNYVSDDMKYGSLHERDAVEQINNILNVTVLPCVLILMNICPF